MVSLYIFYHQNECKCQLRKEERGSVSEQSEQLSCFVATMSPQSVCVCVCVCFCFRAECAWVSHDYSTHTHIHQCYLTELNEFEMCKYGYKTKTGQCKMLWSVVQFKWLLCSPGSLKIDHEDPAPVVFPGNPPVCPWHEPRHEEPVQDVTTRYKKFLEQHLVGKMDRKKKTGKFLKQTVLRHRMIWDINWASNKQGGKHPKCPMWYKG